MFTGGAIGIAKNAAQYIVHVGGERSSNVVNIFDKYVLSKYGKAEWSTRVDWPHGNVNYPHINVNPTITGVPDPHIKLSYPTTYIAKVSGYALKYLNKISTYFMLAAVLKDLISDDNQKYGWEKTKVNVATKISKYGGGYLGAIQGAKLGTIVFPGVGAQIGGIMGGIVGAVVGEIGGGFVGYMVPI